MFLILTALVDQPRHGYGIVQEVGRLSQGRMELKVGTLYGALDRLTSEGLVAPDRDEVESGRLRRYYRLTEHGAEQLAADAQRLADNARIATERLHARGVALPGSTGIIGGLT